MTSGLSSLHASRHLLSRGSIISNPKTFVAPVSAHPIMSDKHFIDPSAPTTSPVRILAYKEEKPKGSEMKSSKKKSHKSCKGDKIKHDKSSSKCSQHQNTGYCSGYPQSG